MQREQKRINKNVKHQGIGGKIIEIEFEVSKTELLHKAQVEGNWACYNFIDRRPDIKYDSPQKLYYGKVGTLGYVVADDELSDT